jgi:hypothetical protein
MFAVLIMCASSLAASVTVKLRVEGSTKTLFEGEVTTQPETFETASSKGPHPCNYAENGRSETKLEDENGGNMSGTPTTALRDAALANGLAFNAEWYGSGVGGNENPGDFFITQVGSDVNETSSPYDSWGYAVDDTTAPVGGCQIALAPGSEVLWAYNYFNLKHLLSLSGPTSANAGTPFTVHVVDGQTGEPISGAAIGEVVAGVTTPIPGSPTTDSNGNATIELTGTGTVTLKATQAESVRSNGLPVCVHNGNDGSCGTTITTAAGTSTSTSTATSIANTQTIAEADLAKIADVKNGHVYARRSAPRLLAGTVEVPAGGTLRQVRISLKRSYRGHCYDFSGLREEFVRIKCGEAAQFFSVGGAESFSYLLPAPLPAGLYVYDIEAIDSAGRATKLVSGVSHVVFRVR